MDRDQLFISGGIHVVWHDQKGQLLCLCEVCVALFFFPHRYRHDGSETLTDDVLFAATDGIHFVEFTLQVKVSVLHISEKNCLCRRV